MNNVDAYIGKGLAHLQNKEYYKSFRAFLKAIKSYPDIKFNIVPAYIASYLDTLPKSRNSFKTKSFEHLTKIWEIITQLKEDQLRANIIVTHYTSLDVLKNLLSGERFQFYNATYMNDPDEGEVFFKIISKGSIDVKKTFYKDSTNFYSPAYIGSFTKATDRKQEDKLFLWRTYGKHKSQEASGACMVFNGPSCFSPRVPSELGTMKTQQNTSEEDALEKLCLYEVVYRKDIKKNIRKNNIYQLMQYLTEELETINKECLKKALNDKEEDLIQKLVRELLDEIRFLFKDDHYSEENEMRVVSMEYTLGNSDPTNSRIKENTEYSPPRLYLEAPERFRFDKVLLGPQASGLAEWQQWAQLKPQGQSVKIEKSKISYKG